MSTEFEWSKKQRTLREVIADFCQRHGGAKSDPDPAHTASDRDIWSMLSSKFSVAGLTIDPALDGYRLDRRRLSALAPAAPLTEVYA